MSAQDKEEILALIANSGLPRQKALAKLGIPRSTYYRWLKRKTKGRLEDRRGGSSAPWNKLTPEENERILTKARASPEISARQLALRMIDLEGIYVSESTVYRILKREGLIKPAEIKGFKAGKEYHRKTERPNQLWATDCCYLKVMDWGWYYLITVMDDHSRFILSWDLKTNMAAESLIDVVQQAVDMTGMTDVPVENRTVLLSDNGSGYLSRGFNDYLDLVDIRHILASPFHPQTNGKIERYHRSLRGEIDLVPYDMPSRLREAIRGFVEYYNYHRYHEGIGDVIPYDVYTGRHIQVIEKRKEVKSRTLQERRIYNKIVREQRNSPLSLR